MVTPSLPSPLHRVRSLNLIKAFKKLGHKVFLFSLLVREEERRYLDEVRRLVDGCKVMEYPMARGVKKVLTQVYYWPVYPWEYLFLKDGRVRKEVNDYARKVKPDVVYIKRLRSLAVADELIGYYPTLLDTTDAMSKFYQGQKRMVGGWQKLISWHEEMGYKRLERQVKARYSRLVWIVCSESDKQYLRKQVKVLNIRVWPNVVEKVDEEVKLSEDKIVVFSGLMDKAINYTAALEIIGGAWPLIRRKIPQAKLWIIGPHPVKALKKKDGKGGVRVWGYVPDLKVMVKKARVYLAWGETVAGSRNKVLQAGAWGVPVVAKKEVLQGLVGAYDHVVNGKDKKEVAEMVVRLMMDKVLRKKVIEDQRKWIKDNYSLTKLCQIINKDLKLIT